LVGAWARRWFRQSESRSKLNLSFGDWRAGPIISDRPIVGRTTIVKDPQSNR
jgi:hypothetical protein